MTDDEYQRLVTIGTNALIGAASYKEFYALHDWDGYDSSDSMIQKYYECQVDEARERADKVLWAILPEFKVTVTS